MAVLKSLHAPTDAAGSVLGTAIKASLADCRLNAGSMATYPMQEKSRRS
jgi:hypothetical protein